jgi:hypothetical protein
MNGPLNLSMKLRDLWIKDQKIIVILTAKRHQLEDANMLEKRTLLFRLYVIAGTVALLLGCAAAVPLNARAAIKRELDPPESPTKLSTVRQAAQNFHRRS